ncbi:MAG: hypothetical protein ACPGFA_04670 [Pikeienuella sp.]
MTAPPLLSGYIATCLVALFLVYRLRIFDLRSLRKGEGEDRKAMDLFERPDLGALVNILVIGGAALAIVVGWRIPAEIERIYGGGARFGILFPDVEMTTLGRAAQVVGMVSFGMIALRLLRILVMFAAAAMLGVGGFAAFDYVFQLGWLL